MRFWWWREIPSEIWLIRTDGGAIKASSEGLSEATPLVGSHEAPMHVRASRSDASVESPG